MVDSIILFFVRQLSSLLQILPHETALSIGRIVGWVLSKVYYRRRIAYANLKAAFGDQMSVRKRKQIIKQHFLNIAQNAVEVLRFPKLDLDYFNKYISVVGRDRYEQLIRQDRGILFMTPHFGNWELSQILSALVKKPLHILARQQKHTRLDDFLNELRSSHGSTAIHKGEAVRELIRVLREGGMAGVLGDLSGGHEGVKVQFFDRKTTAPSGIFEIAERTKAVILPCFMVRQNSGAYHQIFIEEVFPLIKTKERTLDVIGSVQSYYRLLEQWIRNYPEQWFWMYKRWRICFTKRILILKDDRAGHTNQSESVEREFKRLEKSLNGEYEFKFETVNVQFKSSFHRKLFYLFAFFFIPFAQGRLGLLKFFLNQDCSDRLQNQFADIIISTGSSLVPLNLLLKEENSAKSVVVMKPSFPYVIKRFDLLILPLHDLVPEKSGHVVRTLVTPNKVETELLERAAKKLSSRIPPRSNESKRLAIFIGGTSKSYRFNPVEFEKWLRKLKESTVQLNYELLITTSRRTDTRISDLLKHEFSGFPAVKLLVVANESNLDEVTYGMLANSDIAVVTEDSVSMISEAVTAGKQVLVLRLGNGKLPAKHDRFHRLLEQNQLIYLVNADNFHLKLTSMNGTSAGEIIQKQSLQIQGGLRKLL